MNNLTSSCPERGRDTGSEAEVEGIEDMIDYALSLEGLEKILQATNRNAEANELMKKRRTVEEQNSSLTDL